MKTRRHSRFGVVLAALLMLTVLIGGSAVVSINLTARDNTTNLAHRAAPAVTLLLNIDRDAYQAQLFLERVVALENSGLDSVDARVFQSENSQQLTGPRWIAFRELATELKDELPGEAEHVAIFEADRDKWQATVDTVLQTEPGPLRNLLTARSTIEFETMRRHMDVLEEDFYEPLIESLGREAVHGLDLNATITAIAVLTAIGLTLVLTVHNVASFKRQAQEHAARESELLENSNRQQFETKFRRALEMSQTEEAATLVVARAVKGRLSNSGLNSLLVADQHMSRLRVAFQDSDGDIPSCGVKSPDNCRALVTGSTQNFPDSAALDACPYLAERADAQRSAVCTPVNINGRAAGVLHTVRPIEAGLNHNDESSLAIIADHVGIRLSVLRNEVLSSLQASTDPLTGLANRRSFEAESLRICAQTDQISVLMIDLDHFKELNDEHGHDAGDRALRLFADALRDVAHDDGSIAARWGGEEFIIAATEFETGDGVHLAEQLRDALAVRLIDSSVPTFTVSIGVATVPSAGIFTEAIQAADTALYEAKRGGRDRIEVAP